MPRDGSGVYSIPPGTDGIPDTTVESAKYNTFIHDVETDLNAARPIIAGGTGATTPADARANLQAERAMQTITNFDSDPLEAGSFTAATSATGSPVAGHAFTGIIYGPPTSMVIEARDETDGSLYIRRMTAGVWGAWDAGNTMTGDLKISKVSPLITLNDTAAGVPELIMTRAGLARWAMLLGINAETGANVGSDLALARYDDTGALIDLPLVINRKTGLATVEADPTNPLGIVTKQYADLAVRTDAAQAFTVPQREQARKNIFAAPFDAEGYFGLQTNGSFDHNQLAYGNVSTAGTYFCDGWSFAAAGIVGQALQNAGGPPGAVYCAKIMPTVARPALSPGDYCGIVHFVEGWRFWRLQWGTGAAQPITLGFYVSANRAGVYSGTIENGAANRSYPFTFTINNGSTWEWKTVTIPGDTAGAWYTGQNARTMMIWFNLASGTTFAGPPGVWANANYVAAAGGINGAANLSDYLQISNLIVLPGNEAPPVERAPYVMRLYEQEERLCRRYLYVNAFNSAAGQRFLCTAVGATVGQVCLGQLPVRMRAAPTMSDQNVTDLLISDFYGATQSVNSSGFAGVGVDGWGYANFNCAAWGSITGRPGIVYANTGIYKLIYDARL
jgi:hypothetical protein